MKQIIYVSKKQSQLTDSEIETIAAQAQQFNSAIEVTGVLISVGEYFYQLLEGEEEPLIQLMAKIEQDHRHEEVKVVFQTTIKQREFANWSMKFVNLAKQDVPDMLIKIAQMNPVKPEVITGLKYMMIGEVDHPY